MKLLGAIFVFLPKTELEAVFTGDSIMYSFLSVTLYIMESTMCFFYAPSKHLIL